MKLTIIAGWLGGTEILVILLIVVLLFGGRKIPELMRGLGKGVREFKDATKEDQNSTEGKKEEKAE